MLQDVGVSWEYTGDTNRHPLALEQAELAEVMTAWPLLSPISGKPSWPTLFCTVTPKIPRDSRMSASPRLVKLR